MGFAMGDSDGSYTLKPLVDGNGHNVVADSDEMAACVQVYVPYDSAGNPLYVDGKLLLVDPQGNALSYTIFYDEKTGQYGGVEINGNTHNIPSNLFVSTATNNPAISIDKYVDGSSMPILQNVKIDVNSLAGKDLVKIEQPASSMFDFGNGFQIVPDQNGGIKIDTPFDSFSDFINSFNPAQPQQPQPLLGSQPELTIPEIMLPEPPALPDAIQQEEEKESTETKTEQEYEDYEPYIQDPVVIATNATALTQTISGTDGKIIFRDLYDNSDAFQALVDSYISQRQEVPMIGTEGQDGYIPAHPYSLDDLLADPDYDKIVGDLAKAVYGETKTINGVELPYNISYLWGIRDEQIASVGQAIEEIAKNRKYFASTLAEGSFYSEVVEITAINNDGVVFSEDGKGIIVDNINSEAGDISISNADIMKAAQKDGDIFANMQAAGIDTSNMSEESKKTISEFAALLESYGGTIDASNQSEVVSQTVSRSQDKSEQAGFSFTK